MGILPAGHHHFSKAMGNHSEALHPAEKLPKNHPCCGEPNTITSASACSSPDQTHPVKLCLCRNQSTAQVIQWELFVCFMNKGSQKISLDYKSPGHALEKSYFQPGTGRHFPCSTALRSVFKAPRPLRLEQKSASAAFVLRLLWKLGSAGQPSPALTRF